MWIFGGDGWAYDKMCIRDSRDTDQRIVGIPDEAVVRFFKSKDVESGVAVGRNSGEDGNPNSMKPKLREDVYKRQGFHRL